MSLSRKEFFRQGFFSLGDTLLKAAGLASDQQTAPDDEFLEQKSAPDLPMVAVARNERCLARNCGCFSCVERCPHQAITIVMGEGIRIDEAVCTGCADCLYVCPVTPKAIGLKCKDSSPTPGDADHQTHERRDVC